MKVACLTYFVPRKENVNGPSGLLYQIMRFRPKKVELTVFVFGQEDEDFRNFPEVIELVKSGVTFVRCLKSIERVSCPIFWPKGARRIAEFEIPRVDAFDAVWAYPYWFSPFVRCCIRPVLISGMDCATLLYWRKLKSTNLADPMRWMRAAAGLLANLLFESVYLRNRDIHVVGAADARLLQWTTARPKFIPHPFLAYARSLPEPRPADRPLTFLVSNVGDPFYGSPLFLSWLRKLYAATKNETSIRLVLHKAAPDAVRAIGALSTINSKVILENVTWVDDYSTLLGEVDIQLFPLNVGAGTKTSVLTAIQHGVRAICTPVAAENVQANAFLFVVSSHGGDFPISLNQAIISLREDGRTIELETLTNHSPEKCSSAFWTYVENNVV